ncbi:hypothetical protein ID850_15160 [Xenorhabdus sp. Flor]|uniref:hypothetical protein n=1 Tax=Xenorhabdus cabanillasii TaxID=351673 RepID=UPI0019C77376|nr:hypothetical protein [Xenorhabdus sp. Flor]MBD2816062.1 hypothetical protein [Xenorhabdus sp. Flor]
MNQRKVVKVFKGGSLSKTSLVKTANKLVVTKSCSSTVEREYGLVRLLSQKSKMELMSSIFPSLFPKILDLRYIESSIEIDIEYLHDYKDITSIFIDSNISRAETEVIANAVMHALDKLHSRKISSPYSTDAIKCYFQEELLNPITMAMESDNYVRDKSKIFNNRRIFNWLNKTTMAEMLEDINWNQIDLSQSLTHGNSTLENIMYSLDKKEVKFIDCYDENFFHTKYNDYSQLLQCSKHLYSFLMRKPTIVKDEIQANFHSSELTWFNEYILSQMNLMLNIEEKKLLMLYEVSQFTRMLPFKIRSGDLHNFRLFYWKACEIIQTYNED